MPPRKVNRQRRMHMKEYHQLTLRLAGINLCNNAAGCFRAKVPPWHHPEGARKLRAHQAATSAPLANAQSANAEAYSKLPNSACY